MLDHTTSPQLTELARHIPARLIEKAPQGKTGSYVPHVVINQALLATVGPFEWELIQVLRSPVPEATTGTGEKARVWPALPSAVVGAVYRLSVTVDGRRVGIEEVGSCGAGPWETNDGERLKKAASDALKRCAMRLGVAIHLWCRRDDQWFLHRLLTADAPTASDGEAMVGVEPDDEA